ncbi:Oxidoreductase OS=Streptomyces cyaneofuscatus OX=66883 GN=G3I52_18140 PE=4 SV=1 [Streptomyces cyaneofuscatus]
MSSLQLRGVRITGTLDLAGGPVVPYVELPAAASSGRCCSRRPVSRRCGWWTARCRAWRRPGCTPRATCICRAPASRGIRLTDAQIGTDLLLNQPSVGRDRHGRAFAADGMTVGQDLQAEMLESHGELSLRGAKVGVSLSLRGARLLNP